MKLFSSPATQLFSNNTTLESSFGWIILEGSGDTATIIHINTERKEIGRGYIRVYALEDLKQKSEYRNPTKTSTTTLINTWTLIDYQKEGDTDTAKLVFCETQDIGFICRMSPGFVFDKTGSISLERLGYFSELAFVKKLDTLGSTIDRLRTEVGMSEDHIACLFKMQAGLPQTIKAGVSFNQISNMSLARLTTVLDNFMCMKNALNYLSLNQILGFDHLPCPVPEKQNWPKVRKDDIIPYNAKDKMGVQYLKNGLKLTPYSRANTEESAIFIESILSPTDPVKATLDTEIADQAPCSYLKGWYILTANTTQYIYSPFLSFLTICTIPEGFPLGLEDRHPALNSLRFFSEREFNMLLRSQGYTRDNLAEIDGFTSKKIDLLATHFNEAKALMSKGLSLSDFSQIDESRLEYLLEHYEKAEDALVFVDVFELCALRSSLPYLNLFGKRSALESGEEAQPVNPRSNSCVIM